MAATTPSPFVKPVGIAASVLAIVQGIVWIILALCAVLIYLNAWEPKLKGVTYGQILSQAIVSVYLTEPATPLLKTDLYIQPLTLFIWAILYLIVSIIWIAISSYQLFALKENKHDVIKKTFLAWGSWTTIICICDLVLASLLASDYNFTVGSFNKVLDSAGGYIILAIGIIMTLAARGFVLWIVNITFAALIIKLSSADSKQVGGTVYSNTSTVNAYGQMHPPGQGIHNPNYNTWDANKPDFARTDSFVAMPAHTAPEHLPKLPPIASTNERLAKIGRQGAKSPTHNVAPPKLPQSYIYPTQPRIPSPDYSPPNSPLKSALKNRNQNVFGYSNSRY